MPIRKIFQTSPAHASTSVSTSPTLSVDVYDGDGDPMTVYFYNATSSELIGTTSVAASGSTSTATTSWSGLNTGTTYEWYALSNDGSDDSATSSTWSFTTDNNVPNNPDNPSPAHASTSVSTSPFL